MYIVHNVYYTSHWTNHESDSIRPFNVDPVHLISIFNSTKTSNHFKQTQNIVIDFDLDALTIVWSLRRKLVQICSDLCWFSSALVLASYNLTANAFRSRKPFADKELSLTWQASNYLIYATCQVHNYKQQHFSAFQVSQPILTIHEFVNCVNIDLSSYYSPDTVFILRQRAQNDEIPIFSNSFDVRFGCCSGRINQQ